MKNLTPQDLIVIPAIGGEVYIDPIDYAIRRNANLGINDAGKTYAASFMAEQLMKRGIPITVISPSPNSPWRYLKIPRPGLEGFPIVVVGENGDLPLEPDRMSEIMLAAMEEGINIVFDIHSSTLSEAARRRITTAIVDTMYWKNQNYGLRHCFMEEVANYAPQNLHDKVTYGAVERFAREGGNAKVGITMLNPRAESVNKNLLELCSSLFLFQQTGRNSIKNLKKFFDQMDTSDRDLIIKSFPRLIKGRAWYWQATDAAPIEIQFPQKDTEHPDRRSLIADVDILKRSVNVESFVQKMNKALAKRVVVKVELQKNDYGEAETQPVWKEELMEVQNERDTFLTQLREEQAKTRELTTRLNSVLQLLAPQWEVYQKIFSEISPSTVSKDDSYWTPFLAKLNGADRRGLEILIEHKRLSRHQFRLLVGIANRTTTNVISSLHSKGFLRKEGKELVLKEV